MARPESFRRFAILLFVFGVVFSAGARVRIPHEASVQVGRLRESRLVGNRVLLLNGTGIHRRLVFQVYALSLYLVRPSSDEKSILSSTEPKYVEMKFLRNVKAADIRDGFRVSYEQNCASDCVRLRADFEVLMRAMPDAKVGTVFEFYLQPDATLIRVTGQPDITFDGVDFGRLLLKTWIGDNPPSERFRNEVLGRDT